MLPSGVVTEITDMGGALGGTVTSKLAMTSPCLICVSTTAVPAKQSFVTNPSPFSDDLPCRTLSRPKPGNIYFSSSLELKCEFRIL